MFYGQKQNIQSRLLQTDTTPTFLEANGLEARPCTDQEIDQILRHLTKESAPHLSVLTGSVTRKQMRMFYQYLKQHNLNESDIHYYYHGSQNMNYIGLITQGQKLNPKARSLGKCLGKVSIMPLGQKRVSGIPAFVIGGEIKGYRSKDI